MGKYLAIYNGVANQDDKTQVTPRQSQEFMEAWAAWAKDNEQALVDAGSPLYRKKRVSAASIDDVTDTKTGYTIVETDSLETAAGLFATHPHLTLFSGNFIEVLECPSAPEA